MMILGATRLDTKPTVAEIRLDDGTFVHTASSKVARTMIYQLL